MEHNYYSTFISVAPDTTATAAKVPVPRGARPTVALLQYEMLAEPFAHTQEEVLFDVWLTRQDDLDRDQLADDEMDALRQQFFAKGQPCFRASPLTKTHGWGVLFAPDGRAALVPMESDEYAAHLADESLTQLPAMRSKRA